MELSSERDMILCSNSIMFEIQWY